MKTLVIGSGGREHAIAWKLAQSSGVERVYAAPGNGGTETEVKCENVGLTDAQDLIAFAQKENVGLTVVGPEVPLAEGIVDRFREAGLAIVGPDQRAARLEASKAFSKAFMAKYGVRTAASVDFTDFGAAFEYARAYFSAQEEGGVAQPVGRRPSAYLPPSYLSRANKQPLVIKADGLAAGKGVVIAENFVEARDCLSSFMQGSALGGAGKTVVLEEFLSGKEVSVLAAVSVKGGKGCIRPFVSARDHKRRFDGGRGPNTGGMGAIAPAPDFSEKAAADFRASILEPSLRGLEKEGFDYRGFIFFGLMVRDEKCSLLEYNVRLGDPETQAVLMLLGSDFAGLCNAILDGSLADYPLAWKKGAVCAPVAVASGYPGPYQKGAAISIDQAKIEAAGAKVFVAGAERKNGGLCATGGRVLAVSAYAEAAADAGAGAAASAGTGRILPAADAAWERAYAALEAVDFAGMGYRRDIGRE